MSFDGNWYSWGLFLLIGFPLAIVILSEFSDNLRARNKDDLQRPVDLLRRTVLPLLFIVLLLRKVVGLPPTHISVRIADTVFWIVAINVLLAFFNLIFFSDGTAARWRPNVPKLFLDLLRFFLVLVGAAIVISTVWNIDLGGLLTALGVGSIVIGLALQDTLGSLFSGIALLSARHFKLGDWIKAANEEGVVTAMNWRSVTLRTREGDEVTIPNTAMAKTHLRNFGVGAGFHVEIVELKLSYEHRPEMVMGHIVEAALATPGVLAKPMPEARLASYEDFAVRYVVRLYMADYAPAPRIRSDFQCIFWYHAQRAGIVFPARYHSLYRITAATRPEHTFPPLDVHAELASMQVFGPRGAGNENIFSAARLERFRKGEKLLTQGQPASDVFIICKGQAEARLEHEGSAPIAIHGFARGQIVLFKSLFRNAGSPFSVHALSDVDVIAIAPDVLKEYLAHNPDEAAEIEQIVSSREDAAARSLARDMPELSGDGDNDRLKYLREMFKV